MTLDHVNPASRDTNVVASSGSCSRKVPTLPVAKTSPMACSLVSRAPKRRSASLCIRNSHRPGAPLILCPMCRCSPHVSPPSFSHLPLRAFHSQWGLSAFVGGTRGSHSLPISEVRSERISSSLVMMFPNRMPGRPLAMCRSTWPVLSRVESRSAMT